MRPGSAYAGALCGTWLATLVWVNQAAAGELRATLLYAAPVMLIAWFGWRPGVLFAALATLSAWAGGAFQQPAEAGPEWLQATCALLKLCTLVLGTCWGRRLALRRREPR